MNNNISSIHIPYFNVPFFLPPKIKVLVTLHDIAYDLFPEELKTWFHKIYYKIAMKKVLSAQQIFTVSDFSKTTIEEKYPLTNIKIVYNGFIQKGELDQTKKRKQRSFLYVGLNKPRKNLKFLIDVFKQLPLDYKLTIVGNIESSFYDLKQDILQRDLSSKIQVLGYVPFKILEELYQTSTALIFPSLLEGFGYPILEAAQYELPVLCSNQSSLPEIGKDGCLYFDPNDVEDCIQKIIELEQSPKLVSKRVQKNKENLKNFTTDSFFQKITQFY